MIKKGIKVLMCFAILSSMLISAVAYSNETTIQSSAEDYIRLDDMMCDEIITEQELLGLGFIESRATSRIECTVSPGAIGKANRPFQLEADEMVTINCTYSPRTADVDFGLITPQNSFRYLSGEDGSFKKTIQVNESGQYYFAVRNNTSRTIEVLGYVYY